MTGPLYIQIALFLDPVHLVLCGTE